MIVVVLCLKRNASQPRAAQADVRLMGNAV